MSPGADDDRVLQVQRAPPRESRARRREMPRRGSSRGTRSATRRGTCGFATPDEPGRDEEEPRAERDQMEDADELVDRRVVDVLLVALVESVELGGDDPERNRRAAGRRTRRPAVAPPSGDDHATRAGTRRRGRRRRPRRSARRTSQPRRRRTTSTVGRVAADAAPLEQRRGALVEHERVELEPGRRSAAGTRSRLDRSAALHVRIACVPSAASRVAPSPLGDRDRSLALVERTSGAGTTRPGSKDRPCGRELAVRVGQRASAAQRVPARERRRRCPRARRRASRPHRRRPAPPRRCERRPGSTAPEPIEARRSTNGRDQLPVVRRLQRPVVVRRPGPLVVDEHHAVPDEHLVADHDAVADEGVALDLAALAHDARRAGSRRTARCGCRLRSCSRRGS